MTNSFYFLAQLQRFAQNSTEKTFLELGAVISVVYVHSVEDGQFKMYVFDFKQPEKEMEIKSMIVRFVHNLLMKKQFMGATLAAEAWVAKAGIDESGKPIIKSPRNDPQREEILIAGAWDESGNKSMASATIIRDKSGNKLNPWTIWPEKFDMWLDRAFINAEKILSNA